MITAVQLKAQMEAQPFHPFRLCLSEGKSYDLTNHDMMFVKRNVVEICTDLDSDAIGERYVQCAIMHITRVEELTTAMVI